MKMSDISDIEELPSTPPLISEKAENAVQNILPQKFTKVNEKLYQRFVDWRYTNNIYSSSLFIGCRKNSVCNSHVMAVQLLKNNGTLVYSTCTITLAENEGIVAWALKKFDFLHLVEPNLALGGPGWIGTSLTEEERGKVQRFGPDQEVDSVGFFFACFMKKYKI